MKRLFGTFWLVLAVAGAHAVSFETPYLRFTVSPENGAYEILDKQSGVIWKSNPYQARFGDATFRVEGRSVRASLGACEVKPVAGARRGLSLNFGVNTGQAQTRLTVDIIATENGRGLEFAYSAPDGSGVEQVRLLDEALWVTDADKGYAVAPVRMGMMIPADSGFAYHHTFDTYTYEGCHMAMWGMVKQGSALLLHWDSCYPRVELGSALTNAVPGAKQVLSASLALRKDARKFRLELLGRGDYNAIGQAYRQIAAAKGWLVPWEKKLKENPERAKLFGAVNFKLWSALSRQMNEESTREESVRVNWTFAEVAQIAEHLKKDLKLEKVLFLLGGWIHRGYDNQHPDILPPAPECGGAEGLADCARRVLGQGYLFGLHDNYQDMYRDAPSWNTNCLMKNPDGSLTRGGKWAGGRAYLTCSKEALELAKRPQNLPAVKKLTGANAYFIDTTYAAGLMECFDPKHPLSRADDMKWKQALSDYAREVFGIFGSECGREWAIPHADFFEGLTGVSGRYYHDAGLLSKLGGRVIPLFEMVYHDCIAMYGKYGYDPAGAAEHVLHHAILGRTMYYHSLPAHLYWQQPEASRDRLALWPSVAEFKAVGPRRFEMTYQWRIDKTPTDDWRVFVHFTDASGAIKFQNDYQPPVPSSKWPVGIVKHGPMTVSVPENLAGTFEVRMGLFQTAAGERALLEEMTSRDRTVLVGRLKVTAEKISFERAEQQQPAKPVGNPGLFTRADNGWAEGLCLWDRYMKNTYEMLSPLNDLAARKQLSKHEFLTTDWKVQRSIFGNGADAVTVTVNTGAQDYACVSKNGGEVVLPAYGFLIESPYFVAFHARSWNGIKYDAPVMFTVRSVDGKPIERSKNIRIYHAFGDARIRLGKTIRQVQKEAVGVSM